jgi:hypothetical protein
MNTRIASAVAAVVLSVSAIASPALAQSYTAPAGIAAVTAPGGLEGRSYDDITTGSINDFRGTRGTRTQMRNSFRGIDTSAKEGSAEHNERAVPNYGTTSGGPAF